MALVVVYDACDLWSAPLRHLLVGVGIAGAPSARSAPTSPPKLSPARAT